MLNGDYDTQITRTLGMPIVGSAQPRVKSWGRGRNNYIAYDVTAYARLSSCMVKSWEGRVPSGPRGYCAYMIVCVHRTHLASYLLRL
jgi:hypothetical protein